MAESNRQSPFANLARAARATSSLARAARALAPSRVVAALQPYPAAGRLAAGLHAALTLGRAAHLAYPRNGAHPVARFAAPAPLDFYPRSIRPRDLPDLSRASAALSRSRGAAAWIEPNRDESRGARRPDADYSRIAAALHRAVLDRMGRAGRAMQIPARASAARESAPGSVRDRRAPKLHAALISLDRLRAPLGAAAEIARERSIRRRDGGSETNFGTREERSGARASAFTSAIRAIAAGRSVRRALGEAPREAVMRAVKFAEPQPIVARDSVPHRASGGGAAVTINSSPTITVHMPPGGGGLGRDEIERAIGDALEGHAERIYEIVERVGAIRARTEF